MNDDDDYFNFDYDDYDFDTKDYKFMSTEELSLRINKFSFLCLKNVSFIVFCIH